MNKTPEQAALEEYVDLLGENYAKMWRFFEFISVPLKPPETQREPYKSYTTFEQMQK